MQQIHRSRDRSGQRSPSRSPLGWAVVLGCVALLAIETIDQGRSAVAQALPGAIDRVGQPQPAPRVTAPGPDRELKFDYSVSGCEDASISPAVAPLWAAARALTCKSGASEGLTRSPLALGRELVSNIAISTEGRTLVFGHDLTYTCCAAFVLDRSLDREGGQSIITVVERNEGEHCRCLCDYQITGTIGPLPPGSYTLRVYGELGAARARQLLFERSTVIGGELPPAGAPTKR